LLQTSIILLSTLNKPKSDLTKVTGTNPFHFVHPPSSHSLSRSQRVPAIPIWDTLSFIPVVHQNLGVTQTLSLIACCVSGFCRTPRGIALMPYVPNQHEFIYYKSTPFVTFESVNEVDNTTDPFLDLSNFKFDPIMVNVIHAMIICQMSNSSSIRIFAGRNPPFSENPRSDACKSVCR
jgi:hypothetical protein